MDVVSIFEDVKIVSVMPDFPPNVLKQAARVAGWTLAMASNMICRPGCAPLGLIDLGTQLTTAALRRRVTNSQCTCEPHSIINFLILDDYASTLSCFLMAE